MAASYTLKVIVLLSCYNLVITSIMASFSMHGCGLRTRGGRGRGRGRGLSSTSGRLDNNFFAVLSEPGDTEQDGDDSDTHENLYLDMTVGYDGDDGDENNWDVVRSKQTKRQRVSSSGQSGRDVDLLPSPTEPDAGEHYDFLSTGDKLSLILSKLSLNEQRVKYIQDRVDSMLPLKKRVMEIENVVKSHTERLKLLEYRSLDSEARSRRRNLLFKGIPENRNENCFHEARRFIQEKLNISTDMYLERAHRLGRFDPSKIRPLIVAFRDFCDTEYILNEAKCLRGTDLGVSRDYPNEISRARQSIWKQYKTTRENNPRKKVTFGYPASIRVNGVTVVDLFPDWFNVLKGSRISLPKTQSNHSAKSGDQQTLIHETGLTGICSAPEVFKNNDVSRGQAESVAPTTNRSCPTNEANFYNRDLVEGDSETGDYEPLSQSLLPQENPDAVNVTSAIPATEESAENREFVTPRGRSLTRRPNANSVTGGKSSHPLKICDSKASKSVTKSRSRNSLPLSSTRTKKSSSRSVSRRRDTKDLADSNQNKSVDDNQRPGGSSREITNA